MNNNVVRNLLTNNQVALFHIPITDNPVTDNERPLIATVAVVRGSDGTFRAGVAVQSPEEETYNKRRGNNIALGRALHTNELTTKYRGLRGLVGGVRGDGGSRAARRVHSYVANSRNNIVQRSLFAAAEDLRAFAGQHDNSSLLSTLVEQAANTVNNEFVDRRLRKLQPVAVAE